MHAINNNNNNTNNDNVLNIRDQNLGDAGFVKWVSLLLQEHASNPSRLEQIETLDLAINSLHDFGASLARVLPMMTSLTRLQLGGGRIAVDYFEEAEVFACSSDGLINPEYSNVMHDPAKEIKEILFHLPKCSDFKLKHLDLEFCRIGDAGMEELKLGLMGAQQQQQQYLEHLNVGNCNISDLGVQQLFSPDVMTLPNLRDLYLHGNCIRATGVQCLASFLLTHAQSLSLLKLGINQIGIAGTQALASWLCNGPNATSLQGLDLCENAIENEGVLALSSAFLSRSFPAFERLGLSENGIMGTNGGILLANVITALQSSLTSLGLGKNKLGDGMKDVAAALKLCSHLRFVNLQENGISRGVGVVSIVDAVASLTRLELLAIGDSHFGDEGMVMLAEAMEKGCIKTLRNFQPWSNSITHVGACRLAQALNKFENRLTCLYIDSNMIGPEGATALSQALNSNLTDLGINGDISIGCVGALALVRSLSGSCTRMLDLQNWCDSIGPFATMRLTDKATNLSLKFVGMQNLVFQPNTVTATNIADIANFIAAYGENLAYIGIGNNPRIGEGGDGWQLFADSLVTCHRLGALGLGNAGIGPEEMSIISNAFYQHPFHSFTKLYLWGNFIGPNGARELGKCLSKSCKNLRVLQLSGNGIRGEGMRDLMLSLTESCHSLTDLNVSLNYIQDAGAICLAQAVHCCTELRVLNLSNNGIGHEGIIALAASLQQHCKLLHDFAIGSNEIGVTEAVALIGMNSSCPQFFNLQFWCDTIGTVDTIEVASTLGYPPTLGSLTKLEFPSEFIRGDNITKVANFIRAYGHSLLLLGLRSNPGIADIVEGTNEDGVALFSSTLSVCTNLVTLGIGNTNIGSEGTITFINALKSRSLENLQIWQNYIKPEGGIALMSKLCSLGLHQSLNTLGLGSNKLGPKGAEAFASAFQFQHRLVHLNITDNELGVEGTRAIAGWLKSTSCDMLQELWIGGNAIGDDGAEALASALPSSLNSLDVSYDSLTDTGFAAFCKMNAANNLRNLNVLGNCIEKIPLEFLKFVCLEKFIANEHGWRYPPAETVKSGIESIRKFLDESSKHGTEKYNRIRMMLVGLGEVGKTSLMRAIMSDYGKTNAIAQANRTEGIDLCEWNPKNSPLHVSIWDFAGQEVYYVGHQLFLSSRCLYVLVWKPDVGGESGSDDDAAMQKMIETWIRTIHEHVPGATIVLVGTHADDQSTLGVSNVWRERVRCVGQALERILNEETEKSVAMLQDEIEYIENGLKQLKYQDQQYTDGSSSNNNSNSNNGNNGDGMHGGNESARQLREEEKNAMLDMKAEINKLLHRVSGLVDKNGKALKLKVVEGETVDSITGSGIVTFREQIVKLMQDMPFMHDEHPTSYRSILTHVLEWWRYRHQFDTTLRIHCKKSDVTAACVRWGTDTVWDAMLFWAALGQVYIYEGDLFLDPLVLMKAMKPLLHHNVVTRYSSADLAGMRTPSYAIREHLEEFEHTGRISEDIVRNVLWKDINEKAHDSLLAALSHVGILCKIECNRSLLTWLVPSRLQHNAEVNNLVANMEQMDVKTVVYRMRGRIPGGLFSRLIANLFAKAQVLTDENALFTTMVNENSAVISRNRDLAITICALDKRGTDAPVTGQDWNHGIRVQWRGSDTGLFRIACSAIEKLLLNEYCHVGWKCEVQAYKSRDAHAIQFIRGISDALESNGTTSCVGFCRVHGVKREMSLHVALKIPPPEIFLSHCWTDGTKGFCRWLKTSLQEVTGMQVWMDEEQIGEYGEIRKAMISGINNCKVAIMCGTPMYMTRPNCQIEVEHTINRYQREDGKFRFFFLALNKYLMVGSKQWGSQSDITEGGCREAPMNDAAIKLLHLAQNFQMFSDWSEVNATLSDSGTWNRSLAETKLLALAKEILKVTSIDQDLEELCNDDNINNNAVVAAVTATASAVAKDNSGSINQTSLMIISTTIAVIAIAAFAILK